MEAARMPRLQAKSFDAPDEVRSTPNVRFETVGLDDATIGHCQFAPGWRWSTEFGQQLGLASCPIRHLGYSISGNVRVVMDDGETLDIGPNMVFDIPPGHDQWVIGDEPWVTVEWGASGRALSEALEDPGTRSLATVLFTDIVESTARLKELGDARWRDLLAVHNARLREQVNVFRGREVATTGDGLLVIFDSPTRAVRCAAAMIGAARAVGVEIRVGVHTGEVELVGDDVRGIAVHVAARILALAGAGEVMVSSTTAELLEGSGLQLSDAGRHELKGLTGDRQVFRLATTG
jgi:class 3 adenylate cyclase